MNFEDYFLEPTARTSRGIRIEVVEEKYNAKFMGNFCVKTKHGWSDQPIAIFWQETPPVEGYSHYFGLFVQDGTLLITDGSSAFSEPIEGIVANNGEVIYSRYRHDFHYSSDQSVAIDGGRDYTRCLGEIHNPRVQIVADGPTLKIVAMPTAEQKPIAIIGSDNDVAIGHQGSLF